MVIMGLDPGIAHTGYAVIEKIDHSSGGMVGANCIDRVKNKGQGIKLKVIGIIETSAKSPLVDRLKIIGQSLELIIKQYQPQEISIEEIFIAQNPKLALNLGQARGVALYVAGLGGIDIFEYTPLKVKEAIVGYGRASKDQVRKMTGILLNLKDLDVHDDASDALALAICHYHTSEWRYRLEKRSKES